MKVVIDSMAHLRKDSFSQSDILLIKRRLMIEPKQDAFNPNPEPIRMYQDGVQSIAVPREFFFSMARQGHEIIDATSEGAPMKELDPIRLDPKRNQPYVVAQIMNYLRERKSYGGILNATTGSGKTVCALEIARRLGRATIVKVYKGDLADQWEKRIREFLPKASIGRIQGNILDYKGKDFTIAMIQTLVSRKDQLRGDKDLVNYFGLDIVDECRRVGAKEWCLTADIFNSKYRLGLDATVRRKDKCEKVFEYHIGKIIISSEGGALDPDIYFFETGFTYPESVNFNNLPMVTQLKWLARNMYRNKVIVNQIVKAIAANRKIMVLSKFIDHLQTLERLTQLSLKTMADSDPKYDFLRNKSTGFYVGALYTGDERTTKKGEKEKVKQKQSKEDLEIAAGASCIFASYKMAEDALDIKELDTLVMVLPIGDPIQSVGRILRFCEGKKKPLVVDITDENVGMCSGMKRARVRYYEQKGWSLKVGK